MDPEANIKEQRELARSIIEKRDRVISAGMDVAPDDAERLAELVQALDEWRLAGGFDPYTVPR